MAVRVIPKSIREIRKSRSNFFFGSRKMSKIRFSQNENWTLPECFYTPPGLGNIFQSDLRSLSHSQTSLNAREGAGCPASILEKSIFQNLAILIFFIFLKKTLLQRKSYTKSMVRIRHPKIPSWSRKFPGTSRRRTLSDLLSCSMRFF